MVKSNFWIAQHFYQYVKNMKIDINIIIIYDTFDVINLTKDHVILVLDDCAYTGSQLSSEIFSTFTDLDLNKNTKFNIYVIIAFISENAIKRISRNKQKIKYWIDCFVNSNKPTGLFKRIVSYFISIIIKTDFSSFKSKFYSNVIGLQFLL